MQWFSMCASSRTSTQSEKAIFLWKINNSIWFSLQYKNKKTFYSCHRPKLIGDYTLNPIHFSIWTIRLLNFWIVIKRQNTFGGNG